jgi:hypothetical protein
MALYMMGFGGTIPLGLLIAGPVATRTNITAVVVAGAVVAMLLAANAARPALRADQSPR